MDELKEIWDLFKERYINPKKTIKSERILFWKLKQYIEDIRLFTQPPSLSEEDKKRILRGLFDDN